MKSTLAVSFATEDSDILVNDLLTQVLAEIPKGVNGCGILTMEPGSAIAEVSAELHAALGIPIIGCTALAQFSSRGYHTDSVTLLVLHKEDCQFAVALTEPLVDMATARDSIAKVFNVAYAALQGNELACIFALSSRDAAVNDNFRLSVLDELGGGAPIFGGVASDYLQFTEDVVFLNGYTIKGGMVFLLIGGNITPRFIVRNLPPTRLPLSKITASEGNFIQAIDGKLTADFMREHCADISPMGLLHVPLRIHTVDTETGTAEEYIRHIIWIDPITGYGNVSNHLPVGTILSIQTVSAQDLMDATADAMKEAFKQLTQMQADDPLHGPHAVLSVSCAGRHAILGTRATQEGDSAGQTFGEKVHITGFYSMGEFCPSFVIDKTAKNRMHQMSIALCLL